MALLAESLVDEWLNRQGFFTVRGLKHGNDEIDLLGVRPRHGGFDAWHIEVQASFRPIGYIAPVTDEIAKRFDATPKSAKKRPENIIDDCAVAWVDAKFKKDGKVRTREQAWPKQDWKFVFVHAVVREPRELEVIKRCGVDVIEFSIVLASLKHKAGRLRGGAGTDLSEIMEYFNSHIAAHSDA